MKLQYLGDSKDSFTWDYLDFIAKQLGVHHLNIFWMMTPDDKTTQGSTPPERFPAHEKIIALCYKLRETRDIKTIHEMPKLSGANYKINSFTPLLRDTAFETEEFVIDCTNSPQQMIFIDPDNGFEPAKKATEKHVKYNEIRQLLALMTDDGIICVLQHHRRKNFVKDFEEIKQKCNNKYICAIYWQSIMFVVLTKTSAKMDEIILLNQEYALNRPVNLI